MSEDSSKNQSTPVQIDPSWKEHLNSEFQQPYMVKLRKFLVTEIKKKTIIYPRPTEYFEALNKTPFDQVKVVIVGQDPYHGLGQAHGLCFSVPKGAPIPPSLKNIFGELKKDVGISYPSHGCLESWAEQGILLLNSVLTVSSGQPGSHQNYGWEKFTDCILSILNKEKQNIVFLLWGSYAASKGQFLDEDRHLILQAPHPSPLSAHRGFLGCSHFSKANEYLKSHDIKEINWSISP